MNPTELAHLFSTLVVVTLAAVVPAALAAAGAVLALNTIERRQVPGQHRPRR